MRHLFADARDLAGGVAVIAALVVAVMILGWDDEACGFEGG